VFEYIAKGTCMEMAHIFKEHRDEELESARKICSKNLRYFNKDSIRKRKRENGKKENGVCSDKTTNLLLRK
jgi:hypothetical protein